MAESKSSQRLSHWCIYAANQNPNRHIVAGTPTPLYKRLNLLTQDIEEQEGYKPESLHTSLKVTFTGPELRAFKSMAESLEVSENILIAHAISSQPIDIAMRRREKKIVSTAIEKIMNNSMSNFSQLDTLMKDTKNGISNERRLKIELGLRLISEAFYKIIDRSKKQKQVIEKAVSNQNYKLSLEQFKTETVHAAMKYHEAKRNRALNQQKKRIGKNTDSSLVVTVNTTSKNFRVDRKSALQFKEEKNQAFGIKSMVTQGLVSRFENLEISFVEYEETKTFHPQLLKALNELGDHFKNKKITIALDTDNERIIDGEFLGVTKKLKVIHDILIQNIPKQ